MHVYGKIAGKNCLKNQFDFLEQITLKIFEYSLFRESRCAVSYRVIIREATEASFL